MEILDNLDKNNLHHAYLIEGTEEEIVPEIFKFMEILGIETSANPDFYHISVDSFKIEDARNLKSVEHEKSFSTGKKIFLISANNFLLEAQNTLLKIFEEPIENTHFFIIIPNTDTLLKTLVSRFYLIKTKTKLGDELKEAEKFMALPLKNRIDFIKELLVEPEKDAGIVLLDSTRSKALKFLNALETISQSKFLKNSSGLTLPGVPGGTHTIQNSLEIYFKHIFKVREFLNQPGSSVKNLMESLALITPNFKLGNNKIVEYLIREYSQLNIGRASPVILDGVSVESYGSYVPLKNVASVSIEDPKTLRITPWDKNQIKEIEKAIVSSNLGLSVAVDTSGIRVIFPQLTTETRQTLVKVLKEKLEESRITVRKERERVWDEIQKLEKEGKITDDDKFKAKEDLQKIIDETNKNLENIFEKKEKEVLG